MFDRVFLVDTGERLVRAFLVGFLNLLLVVPGVLDLSVSGLQAAAGGGLHASLTLLLALLTKPIGDQKTASVTLAVRGIQRTTKPPGL